VHYAHADPVNSQEKVISGAGAFAMHLLFLALLVFGINWQHKVEPQVNVVDLWPSIAPTAPKAEPAPPPPPPPQVKPEVKPVEPPPVKEVAKPEVAKPDIALKEKAEKERRIAEEKQKEAKKREEEQKVALAKQQAEAQRLAKEQEDAQRKIAEQAAAAQAKLKNEYIERIRKRIKNFIVLPPNLQGNPEAEFDVVLLPSGEVLDVKTRRGSGFGAYDDAVERAIRKAQPLPLPPDPALFNDFRELNLKFRPKE